VENEEPSRVVHLRIKNSTILGCHKLTELQQGATDTPMSTMLAGVLDSLVDKLVLSGKLPSVEDHAAGVVLNSIYRVQIDDEGDIAVEEIIEPDMFEDFLDSVDVEEESIQSNLAIHEIPLDKDFQKRSPDEQQENDLDIDYAPEPPWETEAYTPFYSLEAQAPKDILIEAAQDNPHLQRAIELVYGTIPVEMWGGPKAQALVAEVMPTVVHYLGPMPTDQPEENHGDDQLDNGTT